MTQGLHERGMLITRVAPDASPARLPSASDLGGDDQARVDSFIQRASAATTLRAYRSDLATFVAWCAQRGYPALPATPSVTAANLTELTTSGSVFSQGRALSKASIGRRLAAIVFAHRAAHIDPPTTQPGAAALEKVMRGIRNAKRSEAVAKKRPADADTLRDMIRAITETDCRIIAIAPCSASA
jgi:hypothetical protein